MECIVHRVPMRDPGDVSAILRLIDEGSIAPREIVAILGKTEGNGCVNDFTRGYATMALSAALAKHLGIAAEEVPSRVAIVMSGGTEGGLSPHFLVFGVREYRHSRGQRKSLAIGTASTPVLLPEQIGRMPQVELTAAAVRAAIERAAIADDADVHWVQIKCPLLTSERIEAAVARGRKTVTTSAYGSMGYSRGASAIGVARALGEAGEGVGEAQVLKDWDCYSSVASASAGIELMHNVVIVMGNSPASQSPFVIGHAVMRDAIDFPAVADAIRSVGLDPLDVRSQDRIVNIFAKAEASPDGLVRGLRHTMLEASDINATRHARAAVGGLIGGLAGTGAVYVSGGAEHQGPPGGGPIAVIARG